MIANCGMENYSLGRRMPSAENFVQPAADDVCQAGGIAAKAPEAPKILILSLAKSGTTILYQILKKSLPHDALCLFEPQTCRLENVSAGRDNSALSKVLIEPHNGRDHYRPQACACFNKRIFLRAIHGTCWSACSFTFRIIRRSRATSGVLPNFSVPCGPRNRTRKAYHCSICSNSQGT